LGLGLGLGFDVLGLVTRSLR